MLPQLPNISIVIPTLDDDEELQECLEALAALRGGFHLDVVVADGADSEATKTICAKYDSRHTTGKAGRGTQMNAGAALANGELIVFLHSDCRLFQENLDELLAAYTGEPLWGAFNHRMEPHLPGLRFIAFFDSLRAGLLGLPYGDQAIFCSRALFEEVGGYAPVPLLEDVILASTLKKHRPITRLRTAVRTDSRRWRKLGVLRTTIVNWLVMFYHLTGLKSPEMLRDYYYSGGPFRRAFAKARERPDRRFSD